MARANDAVDEAGELAGLPDVPQFMQPLWAVVHGLERISKRMTDEIGAAVARAVTDVDGKGEKA